MSKNSADCQIFDHLGQLHWESEKRLAYAAADRTVVPSITETVIWSRWSLLPAEPRRTPFAVGRPLRKQ